jgi:hypothetical protein
MLEKKKKSVGGWGDEYYWFNLYRFRGISILRY